MSDDFDGVGRMLNRIWLRHFPGFAERLYVDEDAQRIEARSDEIPQEARPEGREPDGEADAP